jgi:hypothetical protein
MTDLYLILHKVRGEPAFDIAMKIMIGDEEEWIIPTSGHRAYPYHTWPLENETRTYADLASMNTTWANHPDHYSPHHL